MDNRPHAALEQKIDRLIRVVEKVAWHNEFIRRLQELLGLPTKNDLEEMENKVMDAIRNYSEAVNASFTAIGEGVDQVVAVVDDLTKSQAGLVKDIGTLKAKIDQLQSNPGTLSPEDQKLLDDSQALAASLASKASGNAAALKAVSDSLKELDAQTADEELPEPPPTEPPVETPPQDGGLFPSVSPPQPPPLAGPTG